MDRFANGFVSDNIEHIILGYVSEKGLHGYGIMKAVRRDHGVYLGASTVYPALHRLEEQGLIRGKWDFSSDKPRRVYEITNKGEAKFKTEQMVIRRILSAIG